MEEFKTDRMSCRKVLNVRGEGASCSFALEL